MTSPPRIVTAPPMLLAGIRRHHTMSNASATIPEHWQAFRAMRLRETRALRAFGVICGGNGDPFEYMTAIEVETFEGLPEGIGRMRVPSQQCAVFKHDGHVSHAGEVWQAATEWVESSPYEDAVTPAFELYDEKFDPETGSGGFEVWYPIRPRTEHA